MKIVDFSVRNGTGVVVGMILVILFGILALGRIPVQLNPTIDRPIISVETQYPGAAPMEVESEVTQRQEQKLAAVENVRKMRSFSSEGRSEILLEFDWGVNKDLAGIDVLKKLSLVQDLPENLEAPQVTATNSEEQQSIVRVTVKANMPINEQREFLEDRIGPEIERVPGVGSVRWYGGSRREIQVRLDLGALESRQISINEVLQAIARENQTMRGGKIEEGNSRMLVRTVGQFTSMEDIRRIIIKNGPDGQIRMSDIAEVVDTFKDTERVGRNFGEPAIFMSVSKKSGANTLDVVEAVKTEIARVNKELEPINMELQLTYEASEYIWDSIREVRNNLIYGAILATAVLLVFLRSFSATFAIGLTIPVCTIGTFVLLAAAGRSVNVISLAGLAFASGMVVDDGIVVVENIIRHRHELRSDPVKAARLGTDEVWAPVLISTLTTMAVFVPILFIQEEAGQLFRDIAYSISFAVGLSSIASITVVPMIASRFMRDHGAPRAESGPAATVPSPAEGAPAHLPRPTWLDRLFMPLDWVGGLVGIFFTKVVDWGVRKKLFRLAIVAAIIGIFFASLKLIPPAEYMPQSQSKFIFGSMVMPSGMSLEGTDRIAKRIEDWVLKLPDLQRVFFVIYRERPFFGIFPSKETASSARIQKIVDDLDVYGKAVLPSDVRVFASRGSDYGFRSSGKGITMDLRGPDLDTIKDLSQRLDDRLTAMPEVRSVSSSLNVANPELQVRPDRDRLADLGLTSRDLAVVVETFLEGSRASLYREGGKEYDLVVRARRGQILHPDALRGATIKTPKGEVVRLDEVAKIEKHLGPVTIERLEQERVISLMVNIRDDVPLQTFIEKARREVVEPFQTTIPPAYRVEFSGSADDLTRTIKALTVSFILALIINYLLMAALFESFLHPLIIMFSVPLAMTGAFLGISLMGAEFNVITMLGLILLSGIVVKNGVLLVEFALREVREGVEAHEAIIEALRLRMRPIFMTSATTVLGMLPLALGHGEGTELYNGLGIAVVGGMILSTIFTLILIPLLFITAMEIQGWILGRFGSDSVSTLRRRRRFAGIDEPTV